MIKDLPIHILQEQIMELEPDSQEAKQLCLELARRFQEGEGVEKDPTEAQYWLSQAGVEIPQDPEETPEPPAATAAPIDIELYRNMTPFRRRRAYQAREPGGMYSYALYLDQNDERAEALSILQELVQILEQPQWNDVGDTLLAMAKLKIGQFYADPLFDGTNVMQAITCLEEAALELKYLEAFPALVGLYDELGKLDDQAEHLLLKLAQVKPKDSQDLLTMADIYNWLNRKAYAAACYHGVLIQEGSESDRFRQALAALTQLGVQEYEVWNLWKQAMADNPEAIYRFSCVAERVSDYNTQLQQLLRYMELEEEGRTPDTCMTAQVCAELARFCTDPKDILKYAQKGAELGDQSCRWLLYTMYAAPKSVCFDTVKASAMLDDFAESGTTADKLTVAQKFEEMQRPARAKIWYQEILSQRDDLNAICLAYQRLYVLNGTDEENQPVTQEYLAQKANQGDCAATLAMVYILLSKDLPLLEEIDKAQSWLEKVDRTAHNTEWIDRISKCSAWIAELRTQRRLKDEQAEKQRLAALAQQEMQRRAQEEKAEKDRLAEQKKQARLEQQRIAREAAKLAKQKEAEAAAKQAYLKAQQKQFLKERQDLLAKRSRY